MKIPKLKTKNLKKPFSRLPKFLGERGFLVFFGLFLMALVIGFLIFYKYAILIERETSIIEDKNFKFKEQNYRDVLNFWAEKLERFKAADTKQYPDPFRLLTQ